MQRGASHLLSAYFHLLTTAGSSSSTDDWQQAADASSSSSRDARNEEARRLFNERLAAEGAAAGRPAGAPGAGPTVAGENFCCWLLDLALEQPVNLRAISDQAPHCRGCCSRPAGRGASSRAHSRRWELEPFTLVGSNSDQQPHCRGCCSKAHSCRSAER
jgi:hypothetical protein